MKWLFTTQTHVSLVNVPARPPFPHVWLAKIVESGEGHNQADCDYCGGASERHPTGPEAGLGEECSPASFECTPGAHQNDAYGD